MRLEATNQKLLFMVEITHSNQVILNETTTDVFYRSISIKDHGRY